MRILEQNKVALRGTAVEINNSSRLNSEKLHIEDESAVRRDDPGVPAAPVGKVWRTLQHGALPDTHLCDSLKIIPHCISYHVFIGMPSLDCSFTNNH